MKKTESFNAYTASSQELIERNLVLREMVKHYMMITQNIEYAVSDGRKVDIKALLAQYTPTHLTDMPLISEEIDFLRERVRATFKGFEQEFRAALKKENMNAGEVEKRQFLREQAMLSFALVKARSKLQEASHIATYLAPLGITTHEESLMYQGVLDMLDCLCDGDENSRIEVYTNMLMVGTRILKGMLLEEKMQDVLQAKTPEELEKVLDTAEQQIEEDIRYLNATKTN